jgi:hypothetical protein
MHEQGRPSQKRHDQLRNLFLNPDNVLKYTGWCCSGEFEECVINIWIPGVANKSGSHFTMIIEILSMLHRGTTFTIVKGRALVFKGMSQTRKEHPLHDLEVALKLINHEKLSNRWLPSATRLATTQFATTSGIFDAPNKSHLFLKNITCCVDDVKNPSVKLERANTAGSNSVKIVHETPFVGFTIMELMDGNMKDTNYFTQQFRVGFVKDEGKVKDENSGRGEGKNYYNNNNNRLTSLTKELFWQTNNLLQHSMVHCNLHEGHVLFKARDAVVNTAGVTKLKTPHLRICGFSYLQEFEKRRGSENKKVEVTKVETGFYPHFAKHGVTYFVDPETLAAFGVGVLVFRTILKFALQQPKGNDKDVEKQQHEEWERVLLQPVQPNSEQVVQILSDIGQHMDERLLGLGKLKQRTGFIKFIALCVGGNLHNEAFATACKFSDPKVPLKKFTSSVMSSVGGESNVWSGTDLRFKSLDTESKKNIIKLAVHNLSDLRLLCKYTPVALYSMVGFEITVEEELCLDPHDVAWYYVPGNSPNCDHACLTNNQCRWYGDQPRVNLKGGTPLNFGEVRQELACCTGLKTLRLVKGGCFKTLENLLVLLKNLEVLELNNCTELVDLRGLEACNKLRELRITDCDKYLNLSVVEDLPKLEILELSTVRIHPRLPFGKESRIFENIHTLKMDSVQIPNIECFEFATKLKNLSLTNVGGVTSLEFLRNLVELETLRVDFKNVTINLAKAHDVSMKVFAGLVNLVNLTLNNFNFVEDMDVLAACTKVTDLCVDNSKCNSWKFLNKMKQLRCLRIHYVPCDADQPNNLVDLDFFKEKGSFIELTSVSISGWNYLSNISGLENLPKLEILKICDRSQSQPWNESQTKTLQRLTMCRNFTIDNVPWVGLSPISTMVRLEALGMEECPNLTDLSELKSFPELKFLKLRDCVGETLKDLEPLKSTRKLESLDLHNLGHTNSFQPLLLLENLKFLDMSGVYSNDGSAIVNCLENMSGLITLNIIKTNTTDIKGLKNLTNLEEVSMDGNSGVEDFEPLGFLASLRRLGVRECNKLTNLNFLNFLKNLEYIRVSKAVEIILNTTRFEGLEKLQTQFCATRRLFS